MNYHFDHYDLKIYFMKCIWITNSQNYNFTPETWDGDNMQYNESCSLEGSLAKAQKGATWHF